MLGRYLECKWVIALVHINENGLGNRAKALEILQIVSPHFGSWNWTFSIFEIYGHWIWILVSLLGKPTVHANSNPLMNSDEYQDGWYFCPFGSTSISICRSFRVAVFRSPMLQMWETNASFHKMFEFRVVQNVCYFILRMKSFRTHHAI